MATKPKKEEKQVVTGASAMGKAPAYVKKHDVDVPNTESAMPFPTLKLLQQLSPELDEDDTKYIKKASVGMLMVTDGTAVNLFDGEEGIKFCPLVVRKVYTEWVPRAKGGGFVGTYNSKEEADAQFTPGNELNISIDYLVLSPDVTNNGIMFPFMISFNSPTKMAAARELQKFIMSYKTMHGVTYILRSKKQANKAGQKFYNLTVETTGWTDEKLYKELEAVKKEKETMFLPMSDESAF
jgi:hypothetical protein